MGTPEFAVPALNILIQSPKYDVVTVVTQPDRPKGRGRKLVASPVKIAAQAGNVPIWQPQTLRTPEAVATLTELQPDIIIVAAFGQILKNDVLNLPPKGCINIHASLLPRWRGAAPIAASIWAGDAETGVTLMLMDEGLDTGDMLAKQAISIQQNHTRATLTTELALIGAELLASTLPTWLAGDIKPQPQDEKLVTLAPRLKKNAGLIDWTQSAEAIERQVRAFDPWPSTFTIGPRGQFKIVTVEVATSAKSPQQSVPGTVFKHNRQVYVATGDGNLRLVTVQPAGKRPMAAEAMLNGQPELWGMVLGNK